MPVFITSEVKELRAGYRTSIALTNNEMILTWGGGGSVSIPAPVNGKFTHILDTATGQIYDTAELLSEPASLTCQNRGQSQSHPIYNLWNCPKTDKTAVQPLWPKSYTCAPADSTQELKAILHTHPRP